MSHTSLIALLAEPDTMPSSIPKDMRKIMTKAPPPGTGLKLTLGKPWPPSPPEPPIERRWGHWRYDPDISSLDYADPAHPEDDLSIAMMECDKARDVADWVLGLASKRWAQPEMTIGSFVLALRDILPVWCGSYEGPDPASMAMLRLFDRPSV